MPRPPNWANPANIRQQIQGPSVRAQLIRGTGGMFVTKVGNTGLKFLTSFVLARLLGADGFGVYNFALAWILLLVEPSLLGLNRLAVRDIAVYNTRSAWSHIRGVFRFSHRTTIAISVILALVGISIASITYEITGRPAFLNANQSDLAQAAFYTLCISLLLLPIRALLLLQQSIMQGLRYVVTSQIPEQSLQPVLFLGFIISASLIARRSILAQEAMVLHVITAGLALIVSVHLLRKTLPFEVTNAVPAYEIRQWLYSAIPFALSRGLNTVNGQIDALMLGAFEGPEAVALYAISLRGTQVISMLLLSVNTVLAPHIAQFHAAGNRQNLQRAITQGARYVSVAALPLTCLFIVWGDRFLALFGPEFIDAHNTLIILSVGQLVNALTGSVGLLLAMTEHERAATVGNGISLTFHIALNILLIPAWGSEGAAVAMLLSVFLANVFQMWIAWRRLKIHTTAFNFTRTSQKE